MGQTRSAPLKEDFPDVSRHFFAVLLDVTQEKITQIQLEKTVERSVFSYEDVAKEVLFVFFCKKWRNDTIIPCFDIFCSCKILAYGV